MSRELEPIHHPEEEENAAREGRPVSVARMFTYHHHEHEIPLGSLVEAEVKIYSGGYKEDRAEVNLKGTCKLYVVGHMRDCDGTPLYILSNIPVECPTMHGANTFSPYWCKYMAVAQVYETGYNADNLKVLGHHHLHPDIASMFGG